MDSENEHVGDAPVIKRVTKWLKVLRERIRMTGIWGSVSPMGLITEDRRLSKNKSSYLKLVVFMIKHVYLNPNTCPHQKILANIH